MFSMLASGSMEIVSCREEEWEESVVFVVRVVKNKEVDANGLLHYHGMW